MAVLENDNENNNLLTILLDDNFTKSLDKTLFKKALKLDKIKNKDDFYEQEFNIAKEYTLKLLTLSAKTTKQIIDKLQEKKISKNTIKKTLAFCTKYGYLDDLEWAKSYTKGLVRKKTSLKLIKIKLKQKGIDEELIEEVLPKQENFEENTLEDLLDKKYYNFNFNDQKVYRKVFRALALKGFNLHDISDALNKRKGC